LGNPGKYAERKRQRAQRTRRSGKSILNLRKLYKFFFNEQYLQNPSKGDNLCLHRIRVALRTSLRGLCTGPFSEAQLKWESGFHLEHQPIA
jgi:hypothetical protein